MSLSRRVVERYLSKVAVSVPTVVLPMRMPRPLERAVHDLPRAGIRTYGGYIDVTDPNVSAEAALKDGEDEARAYERRDPYGNHAKVVAIIEWQDESGIYSAAVHKIHSDS